MKWNDVLNWINVLSFIIGVISLIYAVKGYNMSKKAAKEAGEANIKVDELKRLKELRGEWKAEINSIVGLGDEIEKLNAIITIISRLSGSSEVSKEQSNKLQSVFSKLNSNKDYIDKPSSMFYKELKADMAAAIGLVQECIDSLATY